MVLDSGRALFNGRHGFGAHVEGQPAGKQVIVVGNKTQFFYAWSSWQGVTAYTPRTHDVGIFKRQGEKEISPA
jgi:hypothetical protein